MAQTMELNAHNRLSIRSVCAAVTADTRHFIPSPEREQGLTWYHHWPEFHCGHQLHAHQTLSCCRNSLQHASPAILVYDALFPGARGATPLLQSLLSHCPEYSEAWGINSGGFSPEAAATLASRLIQPGHRLVYIHDPLRRLSPSAAIQEVTVNILTFHLRDNV